MVGAKSSFTEQYQLKEPPVVPLSSQAVQLSHSLSQRAVGRMMSQPNSKSRQTPQTCPISQIVHPVHSSFCITERGCPRPRTGSTAWSRVCTAQNRLCWSSALLTPCLQEADEANIKISSLGDHQNHRLMEGKGEREL